MRFIADINNPDWVEYQKRRVGGINDDGLNAVFLDNTLQVFEYPSARWKPLKIQQKQPGMKAVQLAARSLVRAWCSGAVDSRSTSWVGNITCSK